MSYAKTRAEAKALGEKYYFTGVPCPRGHVAPRFTSVCTCSVCGREKIMERYKPLTSRKRAYSDLTGFLVHAVKVHGGLYDYSQAVYGGAHTRLTIVCSKHGPFEQNPTNHVQGKGCPKCAALRTGLRCTKDVNMFVVDALKVWGERWDYSKVMYKGAHVPVSIVCKEHGMFKQSPTNHLTGKVACSKCNHMKSSPEQHLAEYLSIFTQVVSRDRTILSPRELDIYLPQHNLAIEYNGEYHHSHFNVADEKKAKLNHFRKYVDCKAQGIRLLTIYESEWREHEGAVRRLLRNAVGKGRGKLMARKCTLLPVPVTAAREFYGKYHVQGGSGYGDHFGVYWQGKLVACMRFTYGINDRGSGAQNRAWTLSRYATRVTVAGGASRLFKAFLEAHNPQEVKSFSDNRYFDGGMYTQLGFVLAEDVAPDYQVWSPKIGLRPKSHYQRRLLPARLKEHGVVDSFDPETDTRSEVDMTYLMKCGRIFDCGKKRWIWKKPLDTSKPT